MLTKLRFSLTVLLLLLCHSAVADNTGYVYAYFQGGWPTGGESGVFLSYSSDGLLFEPLNNGNAVFTPPQAPSFPTGENQTRDPSITYGPDGKYHMVWTSGITTHTIGYSSSADLVNWSTPERIQVWDQSVDVDNTWAPEIYYDDAEDEFFVYFASDINNDYYKLYSFTTTDFQTISTPQVFYDDGNTVIDGALAEDVDNGQFIMAIKDELNGAKNIWLSTSTTAQGTYTRGIEPIVGPGSSTDSNAVEGPSLIKIGDEWHLYYDAYGDGYLGVVTSTDLVNWTNRTDDADLPSGHHGTVFAALNSTIGFDLPFMRSDLNGSKVIDATDWLTFQANHLGDLSGFSSDQQAARGDLNGDGMNDHEDFIIFKRDYAAFNGSSSFEAMLSGTAVPELTTTGLLALGSFGLLADRRK